MKLLIITQYFPPETGAPQARLYELAKRLREMRHEVTVLTAMPNYPTGKVFKGYRWKARVTETLDGVKVVRTCMYPSKSRKMLPRLLSYLSFGISSVLLGIWKLGVNDVVLIESPALFLVPSALLVARIVRGKAVMMVSDIWPDIIIRMGYALEGSISTRIMLWLEKFCYNHSYAVALTNPGAHKQIRRRFSHLKNVTVISNGVDTTMFRPDLRSENLRREFGAGPDSCLVGYCGLHGLAQGLEVVVETAAKLQDQRKIRFVMIGDGPTKQELVKKAKQMALPNMVFLPPRPKSEMPGILASLDVSLAPLAARFPGTMPSKIYEAMASGTPPIVAKGCEGEMLVTQFQAGWCYEPGDAEEMAAAILELAKERSLLKQMQRNCVKLSKRFERNVIVQRTEKILSSIVQGKPLPDVTW